MLISQPQCGMQLTASLVLVGWLDNAGSFDKLIPLLPPGEEVIHLLGLWWHNNIHSVPVM